MFGAHLPGWNVYQFVVILDEKMMVAGGVGVEIGPGPVDRHLTQQPNVGELVKIVASDAGTRASGASCCI